MKVGQNRSTLADNGVTAIKINTVLTTDANGWKYNSITKQWHKTVTGSGGSLASLANYNPPSIPLPVGVANVDLLNYQISLRTNIRVFLITDVTADGATSILTNISNWYNTTFTLSFYRIDLVARLK